MPYIQVDPFLSNLIEIKTTDNYMSVQHHIEKLI